MSEQITFNAEDDADEHSYEWRCGNRAVDLYIQSDFRMMIGERWLLVPDDSEDGYTHELLDSWPKPDAARMRWLWYWLKTGNEVDV